MNNFQQQQQQQLQQQQKQQQQHAIHQQMNQQFVAQPPPPPPQYVHSDYTASPARTDFHVYRTTQGSYLKVFYNNEDGMNTYNNYELFPNSSFIPHQMIQTQPQTQPHSQQSNQEHFYHVPDTSNTNFFNQLVTSNNDWMPDPFTKNRHHHYQLPSSSKSDLSFGDMSAAQGMQSTHNSSAATLLVNSSAEIRDKHLMQNDNHQSASILSTELNTIESGNVLTVTSPVLAATNSIGVGVGISGGGVGISGGSVNVGKRINLVSDTNDLFNNSTANLHHGVVTAQQSSCTNGNFQCDSTTTPTSTLNKQTTDVKKPRMIAEVKPMRMSYSDVLSKNVFNKEISETHMYNNRNSTSATNLSNGSSNPNATQKQTKLDKMSKMNSTKENSDKKSFSYHDEIKDSTINYKGTKSSTNNIAPSNNTTATAGKIGSCIGSGGGGGGSTSDIESKQNDCNENNNNNKQQKKKINTSASSSSSSATTIPSSSNLNAQKSTNRNTKPGASEPFLSKRRSQSDLNPTNLMKDGDSDLRSAQNNGYFYNITKNETMQPEKSFSTYSKTSQQKKSASTKSTSSSSSSMNRNNSTRIDKSTVYQQKRNNKTRKNNPYELVWKLLNAWFNYMLFFFKWLIALVCDVFMLSFGIMWDRCSSAFEYSCQMFSTVRNELTNNSGRPYAYFTNLWIRFDSKFNKDSKWAIWRRLFSKKKPPEPVPDYYKNGRLPQTGDEAMYSLLNCKGKDAYSILGVQSDCSQEQIRKHYKKIAFLVHPDKNKQPGAEEAFKILQRAFELIGEPENRKSYDQRVAEALNEEKAWSELNDLLRQLQTKIAEAVNTIRCSSCGLRHPRKPTGRPHYAARQCNTCKIRHTAREGDIWAETSLFGLRWKYLALMEGKVLDITEWANCQKGALSHLQPNSHIVQYRIVLGGQQQQQQQSQQPHYQQEKERLKRDQTTEPSLDEFLDHLYSGQNPQNSNSGSGSSRRRNRKN